ncbi:MAG: PIN domain-containing protein [Patescibacteria group bacterium]|nr:PIN domain-containing protein [Patescibacteria group bacterium]
MDYNKVFLDSSMFKAVQDDHDEFYEIALPLWNSLLQKEIELVTSNFILDETYTLIRAKCGRQKSLDFRTILLRAGDHFIIERVTIEDEGNAWEWFEKDWKGLSFTDCVSFAMMNRLGITTVASFDRHFQKAGFQCIP